MMSLFVTGTDTCVGKTLISAGLSRALSDRGINVGVMKPFAASEVVASGFQSEDVCILARAARVTDPEHLINPQFFPIPASPYTASRTLGTRVDTGLVLEKFRKLQSIHDVMIVEGMGGIMTPILRDYFVADLIRDMGLSAVIITRSRIGTLNHTLLTCKICADYNLPVRGVIINDFDAEGYPAEELGREVAHLTGHDVLGTIPRLNSLNIVDVADAVAKNIDIDALCAIS